MSDGEGEAVRHREPALVDSQEADAAGGRLPGQGLSRRWRLAIFLFILDPVIFLYLVSVSDR